MNNKQQLNRGFTLLEILIAMAVFAIMATMAYAGLSAVLDTREGTAKRSESIAKLQQLIYVLNEDLTQAVPRAIRDEFGSEQPAFIGGNGKELLTLTRSVTESSPLSIRSRLQRVSYRIEDGALYRQVWTVLDRTQQTQFRRKKMLSVEGLDLRFYGTEWVVDWSTNGGGLPKAVEANFTLAGMGRVQRLFLVQK